MFPPVDMYSVSICHVDTTIIFDQLCQEIRSSIDL
eukprot:UN26007